MVFDGIRWSLMVSTLAIGAFMMPREWNLLKLIADIEWNWVSTYFHLVITSIFFIKTPIDLGTFLQDISFDILASFYWYKPI